MTIKTKPTSKKFLAILKTYTLILHSAIFIQYIKKYFLPYLLIVAF